MYISKDCPQKSHTEKSDVNLLYFLRNNDTRAYIAKDDLMNRWFRIAHLSRSFSQSERHK